jgi:alpha-L-rhamnosidase
VGDLTWVRAEHECPYGTIRSAWRIEDGKLTLDVTVPVSTRATVRVPARDGEGVVHEVGSGQHRFVADW